jgi:hypothetical protein
VNRPTLAQMCGRDRDPGQQSDSKGRRGWLAVRRVPHDLPLSIFLVSTAILWLRTPNDAISTVAPRGSPTRPRPSRPERSAAVSATKAILACFPAAKGVTPMARAREQPQPPIGSCQSRGRQAPRAEFCLTRPHGPSLIWRLKKDSDTIC